MKFTYEEIPHPFFINGTIKRFNFENGYTASVITGNGAYASEGEYEVAVLKDGRLCYDTPVTDDVIGYCSPARVVELLLEIGSLGSDNVIAQDGFEQKALSYLT